LIYGLQLWLFDLLNIVRVNLLFCAVMLVTLSAGLNLYYKCTKNLRLFYKSGTYWVEDGIVYIQTHKKEHRIQNVVWLRGTTASVYGLAKSGMMVVQFGGGKVVLMSASIARNDRFSDSTLLPLFETILENNPDLVKDDKLDFWYETPKVK
jgi:hypothetical protein